MRKRKLAQPPHHRRQIEDVYEFPPQTETPTVAAAKAGFAPTPPPIASNRIHGCRDQKKAPARREVAIRWLRFGGYEVALLKERTKLRPVAIFDEIRPPHPRLARYPRTWSGGIRSGRKPEWDEQDVIFRPDASAGSAGIVRFTHMGDHGISSAGVPSITGSINSAWPSRGWETCSWGGSARR